MIRLMRASAPEAEMVTVPGVSMPVPAWRIGVCCESDRVIWIAETKPRTAWIASMQDDMRCVREIGTDRILDGLEDAGKRAFGEFWIATLTSLASLHHQSIDKWFKRQELPPPRLLAWLGWLASSNPPEGVGEALMLAKATPAPEAALAFARQYVKHIDPPRR